eukprot:Pompholyxophrys_punicea_v1_NODE_482_length_1859_cov_25.114191.p2 type:complete len:117 gc:universal NODE_482_length_1859_cov_25.114191:1195-1545(+)
MPIADIIILFMLALNENFVLLMSLFTTLTVQSASCERGFSTMKRIKTALRNCLSQSTLEELMYFSVNGPVIGDFPFEQAVNYWINLKIRRSSALALNKNQAWGDQVPQENLLLQKL